MGRALKSKGTLYLSSGLDFHWQLREIASNMVQLQRALNELSEEHNSAMAQSQEKQQQLEKELHAALQDKVRGLGEWWVPPCSFPMVPPTAGGHANCKQSAAARSPPAHFCQHTGRSCVTVSSCGKPLPETKEGFPRVGGLLSLVGQLFCLVPCSVPSLSPEML